MIRAGVYLVHLGDAVPGWLIYVQHTWRGGKVREGEGGMGRDGEGTGGRRGEGEGWKGMCGIRGGKRRGGREKSSVLPVRDTPEEEREEEGDGRRSI